MPKKTQDVPSDILYEIHQVGFDKQEFYNHNEVTTNKSL